MTKLMIINHKGGIKTMGRKKQDDCNDDIYVNCKVDKKIRCPKISIAAIKTEPESTED